MKIFYSPFTVFILVFSACKSDYNAPCRDQAVQQDFTFSASENANIPYRDNDTIGFVSSTFDTLIFYADTVLSFETYKTTTIKGNPECPDDVDAYEGIQAQLKNYSTGMQFWATFSNANDSCEFALQTIGFINIPIQAIGDSTLHYKDSVLLMNKTFYKVNTFVTSVGDSMMVNGSNGLLYFTYLGKPYYQFKYNSK